MFAYPRKAEFGRNVPKNKIYANSRVSSALKKKFLAIDKIVWQYKLSPETVNLPSRKNVPEIEIFTVMLREPELHADVLKSIDNAIPFPTVYELVFEDRIKTKAAFKRPSEGDSSKWVTDIYFESKWHKANAKREPLPVALDLALLYEQILRSLMPVSKMPGEDIRDQVQRLTEIRSLETRAAKIESRMQKEKQFNRKVELNAELRALKTDIAGLSGFLSPTVTHNKA
jgi:hypothetical protein